MPPNSPPATVHPAAVAGMHEIRPGFTLHWHTASPDLANRDHATAAALVVVSLDASRHPAVSGRMTVGQAVTLGTLGLSRGDFHVTLALSPGALAELIAADAAPGAARLRDLLAQRQTLTLPLTPPARFAVESIHRCPFGGALRAMALTARGNDLLVEFLTAISATGAAPVPLLRSATDQIRAAAALLTQNLDEPPTLAALARQVGLSETTLKRGFHQVFGTTVFGYLRARRMERAHTLLHAGEATVLEAAALVGYSNPSNFAAAFRKQFGVNPKTFQLTARQGTQPVPEDD